MQKMRNLSEVQQRLIDRIRQSPVFSNDLIPEYASSKRSLKTQICLIRKHGVDIRTEMPAVGRGRKAPCKYFFA